MQKLPMPQVSNFFYPFNTSLEEEIKRLFVNFTIETQNTPPPDGKSLQHRLIFKNIFTVSRNFENVKLIVRICLNNIVDGDSIRKRENALLILYSFLEYFGRYFILFHVQFPNYARKPVVT